jgi:hypothetical protein
MINSGYNNLPRNQFGPYRAKRLSYNRMFMRSFLVVYLKPKIRYWKALGVSYLHMKYETVSMTTARHTTSSPSESRLGEYVPPTLPFELPGD